MGRQKTISDDEVLRIARDVFLQQGHTATTRAVAQAAGVSEAILYQRFGTKDELFFAAMRPGGPDLEKLLGPAEPPDDARAYLTATVVRVAEHFAEVIPLALRLITHPSFGPASLGRPPRTPNSLHDAFAERIADLARRERLATPSATATARLLISLAHDWALGKVFPHANPARGVRELKEMVEVVWEGLQPRSPRPSGRTTKTQRHREDNRQRKREKKDEPEA
jgi:AcrR family transcriptional regulator